MAGDRELRSKTKQTVVTKKTANSKSSATPVVTKINTNINTKPNSSRTSVTTTEHRLSTSSRKSEVPTTPKVLLENRIKSLESRLGAVEISLERLIAENIELKQIVITRPQEDNDQLRLTVEQLKTDLESVHILCKQATVENADLKDEISTLTLQISSLNQQQTSVGSSVDQGISCEQQERINGTSG